MLKKTMTGICILAMVLIFSGFALSATGTEMVLVEAVKADTDNIERSAVIESFAKKIENDFYLGKYEVTQADFEEIMGFNPSYFTEEKYPDLTGDSKDRPVENVSWFDALMYCNKLSEQEGLNKYYNISDIKYSEGSIKRAKVTENKGANGYRLPTIDEWYYAAHGGAAGEQTAFAGSNELDEVAWHKGNSVEANSNESGNRGTMPVGLKKANELGIYDMTGNASEWIYAYYGGNVARGGGGWFYPAAFSRLSIASKFISPPSSKDNLSGFRICRNR